MSPTIEGQIAALEALVAEQPVEFGRPAQQQNVNGVNGTGECHGQVPGDQPEAGPGFTARQGQNGAGGCHADFRHGTQPPSGQQPPGSGVQQQGQPGAVPQPQAGAKFQNGSNGYVPPQTPEQDNEILTACRYRRRNPPPPVVPVFSLNGSAIATCGNLIGVQAPAKAGKTAFLGAMIGSTIASNGDFFGVTSCGNPQGHALIHFDYEQSPNDHYTCNTRAMIRAGLDAAMDEPGWFRSYCLTGQTMANLVLDLLHSIEVKNLRYIPNRRLIKILLAARIEGFDDRQSPLFDFVDLLGGGNGGFPRAQSPRQNITSQIIFRRHTPTAIQAANVFESPPASDGFDSLRSPLQRFVTGVLTTLEDG